MSNDSLGDRMKGYERAFKVTMPSRMPVILRVDGKAFHTLTRGCEKPFDTALMDAMDEVAATLCKEAQNAVFAFVQSDEISVLLHNYKRLGTESWFDNEVQKIASVSASIAASRFTTLWSRPAAFDSRVFVLPESEVANYFIWRQQDATRNSIQMAARSVYSHKECDLKNQSDLQEMLFAKGINWNDYPVGCKRGRAVVRNPFVRVGQQDGLPIYVDATRWEVDDPPIFTQDRGYIERRLAVETEMPATEHPKETT